MHYNQRLNKWSNKFNSIHSQKLDDRAEQNRRISMYYHSSENLYIKSLDKEELTLYRGFKEYLKSEIYRIAHEVDQVLSRGLDKIDEEERKAYYASEEYKKAVEARNAAEAAKAAEEAEYVEYNNAELARCNKYNEDVMAKYSKQTEGRQGRYRGIETDLKRLGFWSPAGSDHIGHIMGDDLSYDEKPKLMTPNLMLSSIQVPSVKEFVPVKSVKIKKARIMKYRNKYNDLSTLIGLLFLYLESGSLGNDFDNFVRYNYKKYKKFPLSKALESLRVEFPKSVANGIIDIDHQPITSNLSHIVAFVTPSNQITEVIVDVNKFPYHENLIGLKMGDRFKLPDIDLTYTILYIYSYSPSHC